MNPLTVAQLNDLLGDHQGPCISLYMSTQRGFPLSKQNPARYRSLTDRAEEALQSSSAAETRKLVEKLRSVDLAGDPFSTRQAEGMAVFCSEGLLRVVQLPRPVDELVLVADTFHVTPLIRLTEGAQRYQLLCLCQRHVALYEGDQYTLHEVALHNVPTSISDMLAAHDLHPYGATTRSGPPPALPGAQPPAGHGQEGYSPNLERFFHAVDKAIWENHSRLSGLPLVLCAVEHYHHTFHRVSRNRLLVRDAGIQHDPQSLGPDRLRAEAWRVIEPHYRRQLEALADQFRSAKARRLGSDEPRQVAEAALQGKVGAVLLDADKRVNGHIDRVHGKVQLARRAQPAVVANDLLDDIAETVLRADGQVYVVPHDQMPSDSGVAAIYRY